MNQTEGVHRLVTELPVENGRIRRPGRKFSVDGRPAWVPHRVAAELRVGIDDGGSQEPDRLNDLFRLLHQWQSDAGGTAHG